MSQEPRRPFFTFGTPMKYALILAAVYMMPIVNTWLVYGGTISPQDLLDSALASLVVFNPLAVLIVGAVYAWRHGFNATAPALFGIVFLPAALIAYNETALPYALVYVVFGLAGEGIGLGLARLWRRLRAR